MKVGVFRVVLLALPDRRGWTAAEIPYSVYRWEQVCILGGSSAQPCDMSAWIYLWHQDFSKRSYNIWLVRGCSVCARVCMRMCAVHCSVCVACDGCVGKMDATATLLWCTKWDMAGPIFGYPKSFFLWIFFADLVILASRTSPNTWRQLTEGKWTCRWDAFNSWTTCVHHSWSVHGQGA